MDIIQFAVNHFLKFITLILIVAGLVMSIFILVFTLVGLFLACVKELSVYFLNRKTEIKITFIKPRPINNESVFLIKEY